MTEPKGASPAGESIFAPLAHRQFALMWAGFLVSHVGDSIQVHAQSWLVAEITGSGLKMGGVALAQALPRLLLGLFAGVVIDRVDRRRLLIVTQALAMVQTVVFTALVYARWITYGQVVLLAAILGVLDTLNLNARIALMPTLVPRPMIGRAIALQALGVNVVQLAGPTLTALLIGTTGIAGCLAANALTFTVVLVALFYLRTPEGSRRGAEPAGFVTELREGFGFVRARPALLACIALAYAVGLFGMGAVRLLALFARAVLHTDGRGYGLLAAATGIGAMAASLLVTARAKPEQLGRNTVFGALGFSLGVALLSLANHFGAAFALLALMGFGQMASRSATTTRIQLGTPDKLRGRVVSLLTLDFSLWSIGTMLVGTAVDLIARTRAAGASGPLPDAALAHGLHVAVLVSGVLCALATAVLARAILKQDPKEPATAALPSAP